MKQSLEKSNRWISQLSQIHLITLSIWHHFSTWVLEHLVTPIMRSPLWHMFCELFISLSCGVRWEYQNLLYNHKENRLLSPPPTSGVPSSCPKHRKENIKEGSLVDVSTSKVWDGAFGRQGLLLEIVMMKTNPSAGAKELRYRSLLCSSSTLGCGRKERRWLARVILYEVFPPKYITTL